jgi:hypothetical protein
MDLGFRKVPKDEWWLGLDGVYHLHDFILAGAVLVGLLERFGLESA